MRTSIIFFIALATLMISFVHAHTENRRSGINGPTGQQSGSKIQKRGAPPRRPMNQQPQRQVQQSSGPPPKKAGGGGGGGLIGGIGGGGGLPLVGGLLGGALPI